MIWHATCRKESCQRRKSLAIRDLRAGAGRGPKSLVFSHLRIKKPTAEAVG